MTIVRSILPDGWALLGGGAEAPSRRSRDGLVVHQGGAANEKKGPNQTATQGLIETMVRLHTGGYPVVEFACTGPFLNVALVLVGSGAAEVHVELPVPNGWAGVLPRVALANGHPENRQVAVPAGQRVRVRVVAVTEVQVWLRMWNEHARNTA